MHLFWYGVIAVLWAGFVVLEGFTLGAGALLPVLGRRDADREQIVSALAPVWDGNEAWLLAAGTATFFAYRGWFDGLLTGFTAWFAGIFVALLVRAVALNARRKALTVRGRAICDAVVCVSSLFPAFALGLLFSDFLRGVALDGDGAVRSEFASNFSGFALFGAAATMLLFTFQGAAFVAMHTHGRTHTAAQRAMRLAAPLALGSLVAWFVWTETFRGGVLSRAFAAAVTVAVLVAVARAWQGHTLRTFAATALAALLLPLWVFSTLWPNVLVARNAAANTVSVHNAAASDGALTVLTIVGVEVGAVVLVYLTWSYWIFHSRVTGRQRVEEAERERARAMVPPRTGRSRRTVLRAGRITARVIGPAADRSREPSTSEA